MLAPMHPSRWRFAHGSRLVNGTTAPAQCPRPGPSPPGAQSPFARSGCYPVRRDVRHHVGRHCPSFIAHTGSCVRPSPSPRFRYTLIRRVFAGCRQSLLGNGPSRRYLRNPCVGARTLTTQRPFGALARFFPKGIGLTPGTTGSARQILAVMQLQRRENFRGCSHSIMFGLPHSLVPAFAIS